MPASSTCLCFLIERSAIPVFRVSVESLVFTPLCSQSCTPLHCSGHGLLFSSHHCLDFGTSYSRYCFSLASGTDEIHQVYWGTEHGFKTPKTPTSILFNQKQEFKYFGYDAVMKYKSLPSSQTDSWYFFQNFKMQLYNMVGGRVTANGGQGYSFI